MTDRPRKKYFVDPKVQTALMLRVFMYWIACQSAVFLILAIVPMLVCLMAIDSPPPVWMLMGETIRNLWPAFMASLLVLPFIVSDCVRLSNRFVGPVIRLRRAMNELAAGKPVNPVKFRDDDYWFEFAEDFNRLLQSLDQFKSGDSAAPTKTASGEQPTAAEETPISA